MTDLVYWCVRGGLVIAWLVVARMAWRRRPAWPVFGAWAAVFAVLFASMRTWPWNYWLLDVARVGLQQAGLYDHRIWFKLALAVLLLLAFVLGAGRLRRLASEPAALGCCAGLALQGLLLAIETMSLDDLLPTCLTEQPGRYLVEGGCVILALVSLWRRPDVAVPQLLDARSGDGGQRPGAG